MNYKNTKKVILVALIFSFSLPVASFATTTPKVAKSGAGYCANLTAKLDAQNQKLADQLSKFEAKRTEQLNKVSNNRAAADERKLGVRAAIDANRDSRVAKLLTRASTTEQQTAVANFKATLATITEARRVAVDAAVATYRSSVDSALGLRASSTETAKATLQATVASILEKAKTDCANGISAQTVRATTNNSIKAARQQFSASVKSLDKVKVTVTGDLATRKAAVEKAQVDFKTAYEKAIADLKLAFKK